MVATPRNNSICHFRQGPGLNRAFFGRRENSGLQKLSNLLEIHTPEQYLVLLLHLFRQLIFSVRTCDCFKHSPVPHICAFLSLPHSQLMTWAFHRSKSSGQEMCPSTHQKAVPPPAFCIPTLACLVSPSFIGSFLSTFKGVWSNQCKMHIPSSVFSSAYHLLPPIHTPPSPPFQLHSSLTSTHISQLWPPYQGHWRLSPIRADTLSGSVQSTSILLILVGKQFQDTDKQKSVGHFHMPWIYPLVNAMSKPYLNTTLMAFIPLPEGRQLPVSMWSWAPNWHCSLSEVDKLRGLPSGLDLNIVTIFNNNNIVQH